jgi:putative transposase
VPIAPSTYYDQVNREPCRRQLRDEALKTEIARVHAANYGVYGARKVWLVLNREGIAVARCTVERLMAELGLSGATRGKTRKTTIADPDAVRPADLVQRRFGPPAPNRLWVADLTYVSTWSGFAYVAFVVDAYARRILGWRVATTMATSMVLDAIEQAIWTRQQEGVLDLKDVVHHTDRGSQGEFNRSSQHLDFGGVVWVFGSGSERFSCIEGRFLPLAVRRWRGGRTGSGSGRRSLAV